MQKDLQYFLDQEKKFKEEHPCYGELYFDDDILEMTCKGIDDKCYFLSEGIFSSYLESLDSQWGNEEAYNLTQGQRLMLRLFYAKDSALFRDDYYNGVICDVVQNMFDTLNSAIEKAPQNSDEVLYRFCKDYDKTDFDVGQVVLFKHNLTCTNEHWEQDEIKNVYIITPLSNGQTKAHNLFKIYNHGGENQVNFLRGTSFYVTKIDNPNKNGFKKI